MTCCPPRRELRDGVCSDEGREFIHLWMVFPEYPWVLTDWPDVRLVVLSGIFSMGL